ncbi:MAG: hypothetical protein PHT51_01120 [Patescibacteria group bacterium]|nr:hypothetical protein [Patescibacteria group bacterium]MDD4611176.1 hypothetical protein [Patescibacteria group bacterium]
MTNKQSPKKLIEEMKKANAEAKKFLEEIDKKIAELDIKYAQLLVSEDITTLQQARDIILRKAKQK